MDPRIVKGLTALLALALYVGSSYVGDPAVGAHVRELAMLLFGWQSMRRAGDLPPQHEIERSAP